jgi:hypothetical protein
VTDHIGNIDSDESNRNWLQDIKKSAKKRKRQPKSQRSPQQQAKNRQAPT